MPAAGNHRRRVAVLIGLGAIVLGSLAVLAAPAGAEVVKGSCTGSAVFSDGTRVTEATPRRDVVEVPDEDTVAYEGSLGRTESFPEPVPFEGGVVVRLPLMSWQVIGWSGESVEVSDEGTYFYSVPSFVPRGTGGLQTTAWHTQGDEACEVVITVALAGSPGPVAVVAAAGTVVFGAAMLSAGVKRKGVA